MSQYSLQTQAGAPETVSALRRFLSWILTRHAALDALTEVRIIRRTTGGERGIWSGYFGPNDLDALVAQLVPAPGGPRRRLPHNAHPRSGEANLYFSLQGVEPARAGAPRGHLERATHTTRDADIAVYTLFVVDVDPVRPSNMSATDPEKAEAAQVSEAVREWLLERGVQALQADSGNGYHLLVPLVPQREVARVARDTHDLLKLLDARFSTPGAKVDTSTFNPARIFKLYGTLATKGDDTPDRPHRLARIDLEQIPLDIDLFTLLAQDLENFRQSRKPNAAVRPMRTAPALPPAEAAPASSGDERWRAWRRAAVDALPLEALYGDLLTGRTASAGWLECRDPASPSGDQNPSAGVADGRGEAERGTFHSFRSGDSMSAFDFLIRQGRATDFRSACKWIAEASGVPLPAPPRELPAPEAILEHLTSRWSGLPDDQSRLALLRDVLAQALELSPLSREPVFQQIRTLTGLSNRVLRDVLIEVRRGVKALKRSRLTPSPPPPDRVVIDYLVNLDSIAAMFDAIVAAILPAQRFFRLERDLVFVRRGVGPLIVTERNLPGLLSALVELRFLRATDDDEVFLRYGVIPAELARAFVNDPRVITQLPELRLYCRSPLFDLEWRFIGVPGFYPSGVFYDGPKVTLEPHPPTLPPGSSEAERLEHLARFPFLQQVLDGFFFKDVADQVNFLGMLLTAITLPHWGRGHPFMAINGNKPGVGKTTLARVLGVVSEGREPATISYVPDDAELEKQLATRVEVGDRVIIIDNAKTRRAIESQVLERCVTDSRPAFRRLGSNSSITRPQNDLLFVLTMNMVQLGPDLRRRALPVNLHVEDNVRSLTFPVEDVVGFVHAHRLELVAELATLVQVWLDLWRPTFPSPARHSTNQAWASTLDAILRANGLTGFLSNFEASLHEYDPGWELMLEVAATHRDQPAAHAAEWVTRLERSGHTDRFKDRSGRERSPRAKATIVGTLFGEYLDTVFTVGEWAVRLERHWPEGRDHKPAYCFSSVPS